MPRWRVFLSSMLVTLFCLAPLYLLFIGGTLFGVQSAGTAAEGVSTLTPNAQDSLTLLLVVEEPSPSAALVRLDAWQRRVECQVLPSDTVLLLEGSPVTLAQCLQSAGPLQLRRALQQTLGYDCDRYLSLSADALARMFDEFSPVLSWDALGQLRDLSLVRRFAFNGGKGALASSTAALLLRQCDRGPQAVAQLRATLYGAFLQEALPTLTQPVLETLRSQEERLTDITAVDLYGVERLLQQLAADPPAVTAGVPDGRASAAGYELSADGQRGLQRLLGAETTGEAGTASAGPAA